MKVFYTLLLSFLLGVGIYLGVYEASGIILLSFSLGMFAGFVILLLSVIAHVLIEIRNKR